MTSSYAISVVMPTLNQAPFLREAVSSVLTQDAGPAELVVMDGGSTDGTQALLAELQRDYGDRLRWYSEKDEGPADAVNKAIALTRSPVTGWLNSDDLYAEGAIQRALDHLATHPDHVMVYGEGNHVDVRGAFMERYPSLPPTVPFGYFGDGCFICQPTAFFRRSAWESLGGLDQSLRAAFDFEFWLRMFKSWPSGIGFIPAVQAQSRLHAGGITLRFRERVALESIEAIRRHVGKPPAHWLLTCLEEYCPQQPFHSEGFSLGARFELLLQRAAPFLDPSTLIELRGRAASDRRVRLSSSAVYVGVHADGWAPSDLEVRLAQPSPPVRSAVLRCRHHAPQGGLLRIHLDIPGQPAEWMQVDGNGEFEIELPVREPSAGEQLVFNIHTEGGFVPAQVEPGSRDTRELAFLVEDVALRH